jgi:4-diphosphocytidyl-2-C-methyl-D-erythritol kinase
MGALQESAYAKINLALHVRRRRDDGYHELETLFAFCEDGDVLSAEAADEITLTIDGPFAAGLETDGGNLVIRAAKALQAAAGITEGAQLHLTKNLPIASGIGGGSADAAAALRILHALWQPGLTGNEILWMAGCFDQKQRLGADIPACWSSVTARGEGVGEALTPLGNALRGTPVLLVNPRVGVSTGAIFKAWDQVDHGPLAQGDDLLALAQSARNDLTAPAIALAPVIADVLAALEAQPGTTLVRMSGSGATCFALFETRAARDAALAAITQMHPNWWTMASRLR